MFRHAPAIILYFQGEAGLGPSQADDGVAGIGMFVDIGQCFLRDAIEGDFHVRIALDRSRKAAKFDLEPGPAGEAAGEMGEGRLDAIFRQFGRMEQIAERAYLIWIALSALSIA